MKKEKEVDKFDHHFMNDAVNVAKLSYCNRKKVGAVLVKDKRPLANGYNGTLSGMGNCCETVERRLIDFHEAETLPSHEVSYSQSDKSWVHDAMVTNELTLHAEQNILTYCARKGIPTEGATVYLTLSPCKTCAKLMASSGISRVVYKDGYRDMEGVDFLKKVGILVEKYEEVEQ